MALGVNLDKVQSTNRNLVLSIMLEASPISRVRLAQRTGLNKATITNIINEFLELGIVEECGKIQGERGRTTGALKLNVPKPRIISIHITRKYYEIGSFTLHGQRQNLIRDRISTDEDIHVIFDRIRINLNNMIENIGMQNILGLCIGVPGPYILKEKNISHITGFEQLGQIDIKEELEKVYQFPVFVVHDAKLATFAEWKLWSKTNEVPNGSLIELLSTGQGVGAGIIIHGRIIEGSLGTAGEVGYMGINFNGPVVENGNHGIYEYYSSSESAKRYMLDRLNEYPQTKLSEDSTLEDVYREYAAENPLAVWAVEKMAWYLAYGIAGLVSILNPDTVIIGFDYPRSPKFLEAVRTYVQQMVYTEIYDALTIDFSRIKESATLIGGVNHVVDRLTSKNLIFDQIKNIVSSK